MTIAKARKLLEVQAASGGGYVRHGARLILAEGVHEHGESAADRLTRELDIERALGIAPAARRSPGDA